MSGDRILRATLPHPPGINRTYKTGQGRFYKSALATSWEQDAVLLLRAAGFRTLPAGDYWIRLDLGLYTVGLDLDAPIKLVIDALAIALGIDDSCVGALCVEKIPVSRRDAQYLEVTALILTGGPDRSPQRLTPPVDNAPSVCNST